MTASVSSVDICVHATGAYTAYAQSLASSLDRFAFPGSRVRMIVFTDSPASFNEISSNLQRIELLTVDAPARSWPDATIKRFGDYARNRAVFRADLLMFLDADMLAVSEFGPELTPHRWPTGVALVLHPGFFEREQAGLVSRLLRRRGEQSPAPKGAWETSSRSLAYIEPGRRRLYVCGGAWMGLADRALGLCQELSDRIECDEEDGVLAVWHDESHLNWWAATYAPALLAPEYCFVENSDNLSHLRPRIVAIDKPEWFVSQVKAPRH
jgi:histo-blood group ABO system transferase